MSGGVVDFEALVRSIGDPVVLVDSALQLAYANPATEALLGLSADEWMGRSTLELFHPDDVALVLSSGGTMLNKQVGTPFEARMRVADGSWKWVEIVGANAIDIPGVDGLVVVVRDITQRRMWEVAAGDTARFQQVMQHAASITLLLDAEGRISSVNNAFTRLLGHDPSIAVGKHLWWFASVESATELARAIDRARSREHSITCEALMRSADPDGEPRPIRFEFVNLLDDPVVAGMVVTAHDVSDLYHARRRLEHLARHDVLTGLANRSVLLERIDELLDAHLRATVVFIDLDKFKPVNDLLGHDAGDQLLQQVASRLLHLVRPSDLVARVGGDEFVVLVAGATDRRAASVLAERIEAALSEPYLLNEGPVRVTASVGTAMAARDSTVTGLLADADLAMYQAKAARRGDPVRDHLQRLPNANERRRLADDLSAGLRRGEVVAYFQPVIDIVTGHTVGFEALARWHHPRLGTLPPLAFLDIADDAGLDPLLGDMVLANACRTLHGLPDHMFVGVNLSATQLADGRLCDRVDAILREHDIARERLVVEITERATLARRPGAGMASPRHTLLQLHKMGIGLSLDDFGTGYSSLTHVRNYPLSAIKIDRSFVARAARHREDRAVIAAVVGMAAALDLEVVVEGVETEEQLADLRRLGCTLAQGYLISRPLAPAQVAPWVTRHAHDWRLAAAAPDRAHAATAPVVVRDRETAPAIA
ncbi:MAG: EAL domain-containing protein [Actinomycetota bacterium]|nr:EAL domain-containing protein [Actinomycetota bacterium]